MVSVIAVLRSPYAGLLSACAFVADAQSTSIVSVLGRVASDPALVPRLLSAGFDAMDVLFYAIAAYEGYKFSRLRAPVVVQPSG
jgi:hypothetical protein